MINWLNIEDKVLVVTGGSSGIGLAIVESLLELNVKVANFDISDNGLKHEKLLFVQTDVTSANEVENAVKKVVDTFGMIDGVVNNAGINIPRLLVDPKDPHGQYEMDEKTFDKMLAINQKGVFLVAQAVGRILVEKQAGVIINMGSELRN